MQTLLKAIAAAALALMAAGQAAAQGVTRDSLIGRWTDDGNCANTVQFRPDGTFVTTDGVAGRWRLEGDRLSFIGNSTVRARVSADGPHRIVLNHEDGTTGQSTRCLDGPRRTMPPLPATVDEVVAMSRPFEPGLLTGRWTDDGDCNNFIDFRPDGRFILKNGSGRWTLVGEQLTFIGETTVSARARAIGRDRILLVHPNNSLGQSIRC